MNLELFNLIFGVSEKKCLESESVCNSKRKWNHNECWYEWKELGDRRSFKYDNMWSSTTYDCECNKACKTDEYLFIKKMFV